MSLKGLTQLSSWSSNKKTHQEWCNTLIWHTCPISCSNLSSSEVTTSFYGLVQHMILSLAPPQETLHLEQLIIHDNALYTISWPIVFLPQERTKHQHAPPH